MGLFIWFSILFAILVYFIIPDQNKDLFRIPEIGNFEKPIIRRGIPQPIGDKKTSRGEEECRRFLEEIFGEKFISVRPNFLKNPKTKQNLEIDCFNSKLKLAVEYNGRQHYVYTKHFHKDDPDQFINQTERDDYKKDQCKKAGIRLITVPYTVPLEHIKSYLLEKLYKRGYGKYMIGLYHEN